VPLPPESYGRDSSGHRRCGCDSVEARTTGQAYEWGGASFEVLNPPADIDLGMKVKDDDAMVLRVSYQGKSALFCGDIGEHGAACRKSRTPIC